MDKKKKILAVIIAATMLTSSISGMALAEVNTAPASTYADAGVELMDDAYETLYSQDYETLTSVADAWKCPNLSKALSLETDAEGNKFFQMKHIDKENSRGAESDFHSLNAGEKYAIEFDLALTPGNSQDSQFAIKGTDFAYGGKSINDGAGSGYILKLKTDANSTTWTVNDGKDTVTLESGKMYHYTVLVNGTDVYLTIADSEGNKVANADMLLVSANGAGGLKGMYYRSGRYSAIMQLDNILVRTLKENEIPSTVYHTLNIKTNRYAVLNIGDDKYPADVNGNVKIEHIVEGTVIDYTITKEGYGAVTGSVTMDGNQNIEQELTKNEDIDAIYFESDFGSETGAWVKDNYVRAASVQLGTIDISKYDIIKVSMDVEFGELGPDDASNSNLALYTSGGKVLAGLQATKANGLTAFTGWTGSAAMNDSGDVGKYTESQLLTSTYTGQKNIDFLFDRVNKKVSVSTLNDAGETVSVTLTLPNEVAADDIASIASGEYRDMAKVTVNELAVSEPDVNFVSIAGDSDIAVPNAEISKEYNATAVYMEEGEKFNWTVAPENVSGSTKFEGLTDVTTATVIVASYDSNGALADIDVKKDQAVTDGSITVDGNAGQKVMIWKDLESAQPLTAVQTIESTAGDTGVTVTANEEDTTKATLKVAPTAVTGKYVLTATSANNSSKTAKFTVNIEDAKVASAVLSGEENIQYQENDTTTYTYTVSDVKDQFGNDVTKYFAPEWSSSNTDVLAMDAENPGTFAVKGKGTTTIKAVVDGKEYTMDVTVSDYVITKTGITEDSTVVDLAGLVANDNVTGYQVTTAKDGVLVAQNVVTKPAEGTTITVDTKGADSVEVAPVFEYTEVGSVANGFNVAIPNGTYDFTFVKAAGQRADLLVNGYIVGQNVDQGGNNRGTEGSTYSVDNVVVNGGKAVVSAADLGEKDVSMEGAKLSSIKVVKTPSIVTRKTHIYIAGDSTVCIYYGNDNSDVKDLQTGWGQVFDTYLTDDVTILDLANSGIYSEPWESSAFATVRDMAKPGDYLLIQFGINDRSKSTKEKMKASLERMVDACREKGIIPVLITPQKSAGYAWYSESTDEKTGEKTVSWSDYSGFTGVVREVATEKGTLLIDSAGMSAEAFYELGKDYVVENYQLSNETPKNMHFSYAGAQKLASMIAQSIFDQQAKNTAAANNAKETFAGIKIDKEGSFTFTDTNNVEQTYKIADSASDSEEVSPSPAP